MVYENISRYRRVDTVILAPFKKVNCELRAALAQAGHESDEPLDDLDGLDIRIKVVFDKDTGQEEKLGTTNQSRGIG